ncbi:MAG: nitrite reductase (NAD(P)H) small subunit [Rhodocyclaceae bacterium]|nr:nitrite reductase (NAD(P)H) small subunit [Rhodocyclaceae bacterium]
MNTQHESAQWVDAGPVDAIPSPGARRLPTAHGDIAVVRTGSGAVYAIGDRCPHKGGPLSQGMVFGERVQCPLHGLVVDLASGRAVAPDSGAVAVHPVRVDNGRILVGLTPQSAAAPCDGGCACAQAA